MQIYWPSYCYCSTFFNLESTVQHLEPLKGLPYRYYFGDSKIRSYY